MNNVLSKKHFLTLAFLCLSLTAHSQNADTLRFNGTSYLEAIGAHFVDENIALLVIEKERTNEISLEVSSALSRDGVKVSGTVITDESGKITDYQNVEIRGLPISLQSLEGSLTKTYVDVLICGKALKLIEFKIHYIANILEK